MKKIYFLCTGNSCRSQMAEGYAKKIFPLDIFEIKSAGVEAHGLNPMAIKVMAEEGVDISKQYSKLIDLKYFNSVDMIVTLCGDAKDKCPMIPVQTKCLHWPLPDPAQTKGTLEEQLHEFRNVRDEIKRLVLEMNRQLLLCMNT
ncbi:MULTISPECIES: arsenate reductase (thioredoxin) [Leuconostoc]|uniref:arsenate reductase (thioredoxin) n=1 Tax=Leuconostoc suionicum TaxID=1511761 RepID=UPI0024ACE2D4|nr:arsenate reductase (thioredoxin) [Leuconostoc suionicum]MDI6651284.1 arsenate reductase (thioredoxin) [Leuconostoc suionicum]